MREHKIRNENRRSFLRKLFGGIAATTTFPWLIRDVQGIESRTNFNRVVTQFKNSQSEIDEKFWDFVRRQFPLVDDLIYMNTGGLGPSPYSVIETIHSRTMNLEGISETGHEFVDGVRRKASAFFNCGMDEIAFTRNATEGMNIIARGLPLKKGDEVLMTTHEHPGGAVPWLALAKDNGIRIKLFEPGMTQEENLKIIAANLSSRTKVLAISHITCTTGLKFPSEEIARLCHDRDIIFVLDGAQVLGMIPVDFHQLGCDFYTSSGHKWLCGPKGTGILFIRQAMQDQWRPTHVGAYSEKIYKLEEQILEYQKSASIIEYGTRNSALILGIGAALDFLDSIGMDHVERRGKELALYFKEKLSSINKLEVLTPQDPDSHGSIVSFRILDQKRNHGDFVGQIKKDHNIRLRPVGEHGLNAIRASFHIFNNFEQVDRLIEAIKKVTAS